MAAQPGLRERKKQQTRDRIAAAAGARSPSAASRA